LADGAVRREEIYIAELRKLTDGQRVGEIAPGKRVARAAAVSPDGQRAAIAVGNDEPQILIVKIPEMEEVARVGPFRTAPRALEFSHSGKLLAVSNRDTSIVVYDLDHFAAADRN
jgi:6-phosphogluconolactonase (cycloisomerase 2 family)